MWDFQQSFLLLLVSIFGVEIINASFATASVEQHNIETSLGDFLSAIDRTELFGFSEWKSLRGIYCCSNLVLALKDRRDAEKKNVKMIHHKSIPMSNGFICCCPVSFHIQDRLTFLAWGHIHHIYGRATAWVTHFLESAHLDSNLPQILSSASTSSS